MNSIKKLPNAEFEIMMVVWANKPPITTSIIMDQLGKEKDWKAQTIITLLLRLTNREFIRTEKIGKERTFFPIINKEDYLKFESAEFMERFKLPFTSFVAALYNDKQIKDSDLDELEKWLEEKRD